MDDEFYASTRLCRKPYKCLQRESIELPSTKIGYAGGVCADQIADVGRAPTSQELREFGTKLALERWDRIEAWHAAR